MSPVTASTRRMPAATPPSATILNRPMSPVRCTCVPPHSSRLLPMSSTRTSSPYFSPNSIIAPAFCASSIGITRACVAALARTSALTSASTLRDLRVGQRRVVREVEARALGVHQRALLLHVRAQHLAQRLVHQVRGAVVAHRAARAARHRRGRRSCRRPRSRPRRCGPGGRAPLAWILMVSSTSTRARALRSSPAVADLAAALGVERACGRARPRRRRRPARACTGVPSM